MYASSRLVVLTLTLACFLPVVMSRREINRYKVFVETNGVDLSYVGPFSEGSTILESGEELSFSVEYVGDYVAVDSETPEFGRFMISVLVDGIVVYEGVGFNSIKDRITKVYTGNIDFDSYSEIVFYGFEDRPISYIKVLDSGKGTVQNDITPGSDAEEVFLYLLSDYSSLSSAFTVLRAAILSLILLISVLVLDLILFRSIIKENRSTA